LACLVAGALIGLVRSNRSDPEAAQLIRMAMQAPFNQDYTAQATFYANYGDRTLQSEATVYNAKGGKSRIEYRLGSLAGVIAGSNGPNMDWRFDPMNRSLITDTDPKRASLAGGESNPDLKALLADDRARVVKRTSVAGRPATEISLSPKTAGITRLLWIDDERGVILRSETQNPDGETVSATVFRSIDYDKTAPPDRFLPIPPSGMPVQWRPENDFAARAARPEEAQAAIKAPILQPHYTPQGYVREGIYIYRFPGCNIKTAITRYVDGLNSVTVVQAPKECEVGIGSKRSLDFGLGKAVFTQKGNSYFAVMGELPEPELKRISNSISP
jgi:outer membrane lipoprotein-sorting protein